MDVNRVIGEVAARHGVRLDPDDPALVLVTVAEIMLAEAREEFLVAARRATVEFVEAAKDVRVAPALESRSIGARDSRLSSARANRASSSRVLAWGGLIFMLGFAVGRM